MQVGTTESEVALLRQHADVLFDIGVNGRLLGLNEPGGDPGPRLFLARGRTSALVWFRSDVPAGTADACRAWAERLPAWDGLEPASSLYDGLRAVLAQDGPIAAESNGPAYLFGDDRRPRMGTEAQVIDVASAHMLERHFPLTRSVLASRSPVVGIVVDGWVVSACFSARRRPNACEAGVATAEPYRGRGLATAVVQAWADAVEKTGRRPLYSTTWDNLGSRAVAAKLGLVPYAETLSLT